MYTIIHTANIDSIVAARLYADLTNGIVRRYVPSHNLESHQLVFIRTWETEEVLNSHAERFTHPIHVIDGNLCKLDKAKLHPSITLEICDTHCVSGHILRKYPVVSEALATFVMYVEDYDANTRLYPESRYLVTDMHMAIGNSESEEAFYISYLKNLTKRLPKYLQRGKKICEHMAIYHATLKEEGVFQYAEDCQIVNGIYAVEYMSEDSLLNLSYSVSERSTCTIGFVPAKLTEHDQKRLTELYGLLKIDSGAFQNFCCFKTKWGNKLPTGARVEIDGDDLILDDTDFDIQEYVRTHLANKKANEIHDGKTIYINTQYLSNVLLTTYMARNQWFDVIILWCVRRDGSIRYVEYKYDDFHALEPADIRVDISAKKFMARIAKAKRM